MEFKRARRAYFTVKLLAHAITVVSTAGLSLPANALDLSLDFLTDKGLDIATDRTVEASVGNVETSVTSDMDASSESDEGGAKDRNIEVNDLVAALGVTVIGGISVNYLWDRYKANLQSEDSAHRFQKLAKRSLDTNDVVIKAKEATREIELRLSSKISEEAQKKALAAFLAAFLAVAPIAGDAGSEAFSPAADKLVTDLIRESSPEDQQKIVHDLLLGDESRLSNVISEITKKATGNAFNELVSEATSSVSEKILGDGMSENRTSKS